MSVLDCTLSPTFADLDARARQTILAIRDFAGKEKQWPKLGVLGSLLGIKPAQMRHDLIATGGDFVQPFAGGACALTLKALVTAPDSGSAVEQVEELLRVLQRPQVRQRGAIQAADLTGELEDPVASSLLRLTLSSGEALTSGWFHPPLLVDDAWPWWGAVRATNAARFVSETVPVRVAYWGAEPERILDALHRVDADLREGKVDRRRCAWVVAELAGPRYGRKFAGECRAFASVWLSGSPLTIERAGVARILDEIASSAPSAAGSGPVLIELHKHELVVRRPDGSEKALSYRSVGLGARRPNEDRRVLWELAHKGFWASNESKLSGPPKQRFTRIRNALNRVHPAIGDAIGYSSTGQVYVVDRARLQLRLVRDQGSDHDEEE